MAKDRSNKQIDAWISATPDTFAGKTMGSSVMGPKGDKGDTGLEGPQGLPGLDGEDGMDGVGHAPSHKWVGEVLSIKNPDGTWGRGIDLKGGTGQPGGGGSDGAAGPQGIQGETGDAGGGITEAPEDGTQYARIDAGWANIDGSGITYDSSGNDLTATDITIAIDQLSDLVTEVSDAIADAGTDNNPRSGGMSAKQVKRMILKHETFGAVTGFGPYDARAATQTEYDALSPDSDTFYFITGP